MCIALPYQLYKMTLPWHGIDFLGAYVQMISSLYETFLKLCGWSQSIKLIIVCWIYIFNAEKNEIKELSQLKMRSNVRNRLQ